MKIITSNHINAKTIDATFNDWRNKNRFSISAAKNEGSQTYAVKVELFSRGNFTQPSPNEKKLSQTFESIPAPLVDKFQQHLQREICSILQKSGTLKEKCTEIEARIAKFAIPSAASPVQPAQTHQHPSPQPFNPSPLPIQISDLPENPIQTSESPKNLNAEPVLTDSSTDEVFLESDTLQAEIRQLNEDAIELLHTIDTESQHLQAYPQVVEIAAKVKAAACALIPSASASRMTTPLSIQEATAKMEELKIQIGLLRTQIEELSNIPSTEALFELNVASFYEKLEGSGFSKNILNTLNEWNQANRSALKTESEIKKRQESFDKLFKLVIVPMCKKEIASLLRERQSLKIQTLVKSKTNVLSYHFAEPLQVVSDYWDWAIDGLNPIYEKCKGTYDALKLFTETYATALQIPVYLVKGYFLPFKIIPWISDKSGFSKILPTKQSLAGDYNRLKRTIKNAGIVDLPPSLQKYVRALIEIPANSALIESINDERQAVWKTLSVPLAEDASLEALVIQKTTIAEAEAIDRALVDMLSDINPRHYKAAVLKAGAAAVTTAIVTNLALSVAYSTLHNLYTKAMADIQNGGDSTSVPSSKPASTPVTPKPIKPHRPSTPPQPDPAQPKTPQAEETSSWFWSAVWLSKQGALIPYRLAQAAYFVGEHALPIVTDTASVAKTLGNEIVIPAGRFAINWFVITPTEYLFMPAAEKLNTVVEAVLPTRIYQLPSTVYHTLPTAKNTTIAAASAFAAYKVFKQEYRPVRRNTSFEDCARYLIRKIEETARKLTDAAELNDLSLESQFSSFSTDSLLTIKDLRVLIPEIIAAAKHKAGQMPEAAEAISKLSEEIKGLDETFQVLADSHNANREHLIDPAKTKLLELKKKSDHPSLKLFLEDLLKTADWTGKTKLSNVLTDDECWNRIVLQNARSWSALTKLATLHSEFQKHVDLAEQFIERTEGKDKFLNEKMLKSLKTKRDAALISTKARADVIQTYEAAVRRIDQELQARVKNGTERLTMQNALLEKIDKYLKEVQDHQAKLTKLEENYHVYFFNERQEIEKHIAVFQNLKKFSSPSAQSDQTPVKDFNLERLKAHDQFIDAAIQQARKIFDPIRQADISYSKLMTQKDQITARIANLKSQGLSGFAEKLQTEADAMTKKYSQQNSQIGLNAIVSQIQSNKSKLQVILTRFNDDFAASQQKRQEIYNKIQKFVGSVDEKVKKIKEIEGAHHTTLEYLTFFGISSGVIREELLKKREVIENMKEKFNGEIIANLNYKQLKAYSKNLSEEIKQAEKDLSFGRLSRALGEHDKFQKACKLAEQRVLALKNLHPPQLLLAQKLSTELDEIKKIPINYDTLLHGAPRQFWPGWQLLEKSPANLLQQAVFRKHLDTLLNDAINATKRRYQEPIAQLNEWKFPLLPAFINSQVIDSYNAEKLRLAYLEKSTKQLDIQKKKLAAYAESLNVIASKYTHFNSDGWFGDNFAYKFVFGGNAVRWLDSLKRKVHNAREALDLYKEELPANWKPWPRSFWDPLGFQFWGTPLKHLSNRQLQYYESDTQKLMNKVTAAIDATHISEVIKEDQETTALIDSIHSLAAAMKKAGHVLAADASLSQCRTIENELTRLPIEPRNPREMSRLAHEIRIRKNRLFAIANKAVGTGDLPVRAITQLAAFADFSSAAAKQLQTLAIAEIRAMVEKFTKHLEQFEQTVTNLAQNNVLGYTWQDSLLNEIGKYKTEIAPLANGYDVARPSPLSIIGRWWSGQAQQDMTTTEELENLALRELRSCSTAVDQIAAEKLNDGRTNPLYRIAQFEKFSGLIKLNKAIGESDNQINAVEAALKSGFHKKIKPREVENLRLLLTHIKKVKSRSVRNLSGIYDMLDAATLLSQITKTLRSAFENVQKNRSTDLGAWAKMNEIENQFPALTSTYQYFTSTSDTHILAHRTARAAIINGLDDASSESRKYVKEGVAEALRNGALRPLTLDNQIRNMAAAAADGARIDRQGGLLDRQGAGLDSKTVSEIIAIAATTAIEQGRLQNLEEEQLIGAVAEAAGAAAFLRLPNGPRLVEQSAEEAGKAVYQAFFNQGLEPADAAMRAGLGTAYFHYVHKINAPPLILAAEASKHAAKVALQHGASLKQARETASKSACWAALIRDNENDNIVLANMAMPLNAVPPWFSLKIMLMSDAAYNAYITAGGGHEDALAAASAAAGAAAAWMVTQTQGITEMAITAYTAASAAYTAKRFINLPNLAQPYNPIMQAVMQGINAIPQSERTPEKIKKAAFEAAVNCVAPVVPRAPGAITPGSLIGNLAPVSAWLTNQLLAVNAHVVPFAPVLTELSDLQADITIRLAEIDRLRQELNAAADNSPKSSSDLLTYAINAMHQCSLAHTQVEKGLAKLNERDPNHPLVPLLPYPNEIKWDLIIG